MEAGGLIIVHEFEIILQIVPLSSRAIVGIFAVVYLLCVWTVELSFLSFLFVQNFHDLTLK